MTRRRKIRYGSRRSQSAVLQIHRGGDARPTVMLLHGGFWTWPYGRWLMFLVERDARHRGWNTCNVSYRRLGRFGDGGGWPHTFDDVRDAFDALTARLQDAPVVAIGHSAGGHLALWLAGERAGRLAGVVSMGGPTDLESSAANPSNVAIRALVHGAPTSERWRLTSPLHRVPTGTPTVAVHGGDDSVVSPHSARCYVEQALAAGDDAVLELIPGELHRDALRPGSGTWRAAVDAATVWFDRAVREVRR